MILLGLDSFPGGFDGGSLEFGHFSSLVLGEEREIDVTVRDRGAAMVYLVVQEPVFDLSLETNGFRFGLW